MVAASDILSQKAAIQESLALAEVKAAFKLLMGFVRDFSVDGSDYHHDVIVLSSNYHALSRDERRGLLKRDDAQVERDRILFRVLALLDEIEEQFSLKIMAA